MVRKVLAVLADDFDYCLSVANSTTTTSSTTSTTGGSDKGSIVEAKQAANLLLGLQGMSCRHREVRRLVGRLADALDSGDAQFNAQTVGNCFYGERNSELGTK